MHKDYRPVVKSLVKKHGLVLTDGGKHLHIRTPEGRVINVVPKGTGHGCPRALRNFKAEMRKAGFPV